MKKITSKIIVMLMAVMLILNLNTIVNATAEDMAVLENTDGDYLIYLNEYLNEEYSYAITTSADVKEDNLNWYTAKDTKGNKVIKVSKDQNGLYLWVKVNDKIVKKAEPINISKVSTEAEINEMKTLTNRIKVDANQTTTEETRENNVIRKVTKGTVKITDDEKAKYSYDVVSLNGKNSNCEELVKVMGKINGNMNIFESIKLSQEYANLWNNIITNTEWKEVTNATIAQPIDAENGTQYVVLLKKELNGNTTYDAQVLTSKKETSEDEVKEIVKTETKSELPVTFDNPILFVILGIAVLAIIIVAIRIKKLSKKMKNKKIIFYKILLIILIVFTVIVIALIAKKYIGNQINEEKNIQLIEEVKKHEKTTESININNNAIIGIINIPKLELEYPILDRTTKEKMKTSITRFSGGNVNEIGNLALAGHNNYDNTMFGRNDELIIGDKIYLTDLQKNTVEYTINSIFTTNPNDVSILKTQDKNIKEITLITCKDGRKSRLIIKAEETKK